MVRCALFKIVTIGVRIDFSRWLLLHQNIITKYMNQLKQLNDVFLIDVLHLLTIQFSLFRILKLIT